MLPRSTKHQSAFTIVELLIVIVVIAILAAISLLAFNGIQNRARASAASSALTQASKKLALWQIESGTNGAASADCSVFASQIGSTINPQNNCISTKDSITYQYKQGAAGTGSYCVTATSGNVSYRIDTATTNTPTSGGCAGHGVGGAEAVTNLATHGRAASFQNGSGLFGVRSDRYGSDQDYSLLTSIVTPVTNLTTAARTTWKTTATDSRGFQIAMNPDVNSTSGYAVQQNKTYTFSLYGRGDFSTTMNAIIMCRPRDSSGVGLTTFTNNVSISSSWQRYSLTFDTPINTATIGCRFTISGGTPTAAIGNTLDITAVMITEGQLVGYADGNSPNWIWNNTPGASTSTGPPL